jgi:hypothetical protein
LLVICTNRWQFLGRGSPNAISSERFRPQKSQRFPIAELGQTKKKGEQSRATRTSMDLAAIIGGSKTDIRSNNSRDYL